MAKQRPTRRQVEVLRAYIRAGSVASAAYDLGITEHDCAPAPVGAVSADRVPECGAGGDTSWASKN